MAGYGDSNQCGWCVFKQISQTLDLCIHTGSVSRLLSGEDWAVGGKNVLRSLEAPVRSSSLCWTRSKASETSRDNMMALLLQAKHTWQKKWTSLSLLNDKFNIFIKQHLTRYFPTLCLLIKWIWLMEIQNIHCKQLPRPAISRIIKRQGSLIWRYEDMKFHCWLIWELWMVTEGKSWPCVEPRYSGLCGSTDRQWGKEPPRAVHVNVTLLGLLIKKEQDSR